MSEYGKLRAEADGDRRILVSRIVEAPRDEVFDAWTKPEHVEHWLGVFGGYSMTTCELEPRVGATWRLEWSGPDGGRMGYRAECTEFDPPERISSVASFDPPAFDGEERGTITFEELDSRRTLVTLWLRYESRQVRDQVLAGPMVQGMALSFDQLEEHLAEPADNWMDAEASVSSGAWHG